MRSVIDRRCLLGVVLGSVALQVVAVYPGVARPKASLVASAPEEGAPGLGRRAAASLVHVVAYRFAANLVAETQELAADALGSPERVLARHPDDEVPNFRSDTRPAGRAVLAFPGPVTLPRDRKSVV